MILWCDSVLATGCIAAEKGSLRTWVVVTSLDQGVKGMDGHGTRESRRMTERGATRKGNRKGSTGNKRVATLRLNQVRHPNKSFWRDR